MTTVLDSSIFGSLFTDEEIAKLINDDAQVRALVEVEIALARTKARVGVIPSSAAEQIAKATDPKKIDMGALARGTRSEERRVGKERRNREKTRDENIKVKKK